MRIATVTPTVSRLAGGLFNSVAGLTRSLLAGGLDARVFAGRDQFSDKDIKSWSGIDVTLLNVIGPASFSFQPELLNKLREYDPDVVHQHGIWTYPSAAVSQWANREGPRIISPRGSLDPWALKRSKIKKRVVSWLYEGRNIASATVLHALCESELRSIRSYGYRGPVAVIPNGTEINSVDGDVRVPDWRLTIENDARILLFLGRLHPKKNILSLIRACSDVFRSGMSSNWHLCIAGWEQVGYLDAIKKQIVESGVQDRIHLIGPQYGSTKINTLSASDAFILPSFSEGLPMAVLEAWAARLPVLMTPECNLPEGFAAGAALQIGYSDNEIGKNLARFFALSDIERMAIGLRGRELVESKFNWNQVGTEMKAVYEWMLGGGAPPSSVDI